MIIIHVLAFDQWDDTDYSQNPALNAFVFAKQLMVESIAKQLGFTTEYVAEARVPYLNLEIEEDKVQQVYKLAHKLNRYGVCNITGLAESPDTLSKLKNVMQPLNEKAFIFDFDLFEDI